MTAATVDRRTTNGTSADLGRVPPHDLAAEESLLGAMLLHRDAIDVALEHCAADDFYKPAHAHIYDAVTRLNGRGEPADPVTVTDELRRAGLLDQAGGPAAIVALQASTPATGNAGRYARIVNDLALLRRLIGVCGHITDTAYNIPDDVGGAIDQAEAALHELTDTRRRTTNLTRLYNALGPWLDQLETRHQNSRTIEGIATGWPDLDQLLAGLRPGQMITVGARPGAGKSAWAANLALAAAAQAPVLVISVEMATDELVGRFLAASGRIKLNHLRTARLAQDEWEALSHTITRTADLPLWVEDSSDITLTGIAAAARRVTKAERGPLGLLIVDYIQLVQATTRRENRQVEVADLSNGLKRLARHLGCAVITLAQLSRNLEYRAEKRPVLADLRESGAIEQDSDVVLFIYRAEMYDTKTADKGLAEIIVAKQRSGPTGTVKLAFHADTGRFVSCARPEQLDPPPPEAQDQF